MENWCTIESDPGVFTELISFFGCKNIQVDEIYSLDQLIDISYGLIFLFKYKNEIDSRITLLPENIPNLFFANQVIQNACATQAILSVLLNSPQIDLGPTLSEFKSFTLSFDSECKGLAISNSDMIRQAHNSFARSDPFEIDETKAPTGKGEAYHFIAFVPFEGSVYELDGLKSGPIHIGQYSDDIPWLEIVRPAIEERIARYSASETHFNLLSIGPKKSVILEQQINNLQERLSSLDLVLSSGEGLSSSLNDGFVVADNIDTVLLQKEETSNSILELTSELEEEQRKLKRQSEENVRRKHNYLPLISRLVEVLATKGLLSELIEKSRENSTERESSK